MKLVRQGLQDRQAWSWWYCRRLPLGHHRPRCRPRPRHGRAIPRHHAHIQRPRKGHAFRTDCRAEQVGCSEWPGGASQRPRPGQPNTEVDVAKATCSVEDCEGQTVARGWCSKHYKRWQMHGRTDDPRPSVEQRFWAKVNKTETCWFWTATLNNRGYGEFGRFGLAHRYAYELLVGPIPIGLTLDHLCRQPACVRPDHLEPVTLRENVLRGKGWSGRNAIKTHCPQGHPYDEVNTRWYRNQRNCRVCSRECSARRRRASKDRS